MKWLVTIVALAISIAGLVLSGLSDTHIAIADTSIPVNEIPSSEANNASTTATITITMTGASSE